MWLGYFEEFPDYLTQGETLEELQENLRDLYKDLTRGEIPGILGPVILGPWFQKN
jgi:predicted RNase H-like HicB family nuclease